MKENKTTKWIIGELTDNSQIKPIHTSEMNIYFYVFENTTEKETLFLCIGISNAYVVQNRTQPESEFLEEIQKYWLGKLNSQQLNSYTKNGSIVIIDKYLEYSGYENYIENKLSDQLENNTDLKKLADNRKWIKVRKGDLTTAKVVSQNIFCYLWKR